MTREQFEHAVRAAGAVLDTDNLLVFGSQAVHGSFAEPLPEEATRSVEVDIAVPDDPEGRKADLIDGSIGEASMFHQSFGYYAQAKGVAGRPKDVEFCDALLRAGLVDPDRLRDRLADVEDLAEPVRKNVDARIPG